MTREYRLDNIAWDDGRTAKMEAALARIARGRKPCPRGSQRICRDELKQIARDACTELRIDWQDSTSARSVVEQPCCEDVNT